MDQNFGFADLALESSLKHNRSLKTMEKLDKAINWSRVEEILMNHYTFGTSSEGADAYPPLLLFKCLMLQKWFRPRGIGFAFHRASINSDLELENQINDRLSFKRFLGLSFSKPSPDHSTFSRPAPLDTWLNISINEQYLSTTYTGVKSYAVIIFLTG